MSSLPLVTELWTWLLHHPHHTAQDASVPPYCKYLHTFCHVNLSICQYLEKTLLVSSGSVLLHVSSWVPRGLEVLGSWGQREAINSCARMPSRCLPASCLQSMGISSLAPRICFDQHHLCTFNRKTKKKTNLFPHCKHFTFLPIRLHLPVLLLPPPHSFMKISRGTCWEN